MKAIQVKIQSQVRRKYTFADCNASHGLPSYGFQPSADADQLWHYKAVCNANSAQASGAIGIDKQVLSEKPFRSNPGMVLRSELWSMPGNEPTKMKSVYTAQGHYVGDVYHAAYLMNRGIMPELATAQSAICSVGFNEKNQKWAGWSHRCLCEFGIGDKIFDAAWGDDHTPFTEHGQVTIETLEQAKQAATNFADYVS